MAAVGRVLVLRALGLGDLLTAVPALRGLRGAFPGHELVLATPAPLHGLAHRSGAVDRAVDVPPSVGRGPARIALPAGLEGVEVAVNLHGAGPQSTAALAALRPGRLIAWAPGAFPQRVHERERWCALLGLHGVLADPLDLRLDPPPAGDAPPAARGATLLHPGAASAARRWPVTKWAEVARRERRAGRAVAVTGSPAERPLAEELARRAGLPAGAVLAGCTDVDGLAAAVAHAARVVAGDSGVSHLATAFGVRSVTLFGPTPPDEWGPPADATGDRRHRVLWAGRTGDPHAERPDPGLLAIEPAQVLRELA